MWGGPLWQGRRDVSTPLAHAEILPLKRAQTPLLFALRSSQVIYGGAISAAISPENRALLSSRSGNGSGGSAEAEEEAEAAVWRQQQSGDRHLPVHRIWPALNRIAARKTREADGESFGGQMARHWVVRW